MSWPYTKRHMIFSLSVLWAIGSSISFFLMKTHLKPLEEKLENLYRQHSIQNQFVHDHMMQSQLIHERFLKPLPQLHVIRALKKAAYENHLIKLELKVLRESEFHQTDSTLPYMAIEAQTLSDSDRQIYSFLSAIEHNSLGTVQLDYIEVERMAEGSYSLGERIKGKLRLYFIWGKGERR